MRRIWTAGIAAAALAASVGVAGAANATADASSSDKKAITKAVGLIERPTDAAKTCASAYTSAFLKKLYGSKAQCERATDSDPATQPKSVTVSSISVSGTSAKAKVAEKGGPSDGASGTWRFTKSGSTWKVSQIEANFFRSVYGKSLGSKYQSDGPDADPLDGKAYRACGLKKILDRSDSKLLTLQYQESSSKNVELGKAFAACTSKAPGGKSPFFRLLELEFQAGVANGDYPQELADCLVKRLRAGVSEPMLINTLYDGDGSASFAKFLDKIENYSNQCSAKSSARGSIRAVPKKATPPPIR